MIKVNELRNMTVEEIRIKEESFKKDLYALRSEAEAGRIEKPHKMKEIRMAIARCETIIREKSNAKQAGKK
jgi:large subunit ribosomal protein L29